MATQKPISSLGKDMDRLIIKFERLSVDQVRRASFVVGSEVINATPVDTGRAKGNWLPSIGKPIPHFIWTDSSQFGAFASISKLKATSSKYKKGKKGIFVSNNLPYINRLNHGWSKQQPVPGWIERVSKAAFNKLKGKWWRK